MTKSTTDIPILDDDAVGEIEARHQRATPGPWTTQAGAFWICDVGRNDCGVWSTAYPAEGEPFPFAEQQSDADFIAHAREDIPALCQTVRALRAEIAKLTTQWCECGHAKDQHRFFNDHDECYECDQASPDLCCEWRPAPRTNEKDTDAERIAIAGIQEGLRQRDELAANRMRSACVEKVKAMAKKWQLNSNDYHDSDAMKAHLIAKAAAARELAAELEKLQ